MSENENDVIIQAGVAAGSGAAHDPGQPAPEAENEDEDDTDA